MEEKIYNIIMECMHITDHSEIHPDDDFVDDLGANDMHIAEVIMMIEAEFNIIISDQESSKLTTVGKIINYVKENT